MRIQQQPRLAYARVRIARRRPSYWVVVGLELGSIYSLSFSVHSPYPLWERYPRPSGWMLWMLFQLLFCSGFASFCLCPLISSRPGACDRWVHRWAQYGHPGLPTLGVVSTQRVEATNSALKPTMSRSGTMVDVHQAISDEVKVDRNKTTRWAAVEPVGYFSKTLSPWRQYRRQGKLDQGERLLPAERTPLPPFIVVLTFVSLFFFLFAVLDCLYFLRCSSTGLEGRGYVIFFLGHMIYFAPIMSAL